MGKTNTPERSRERVYKSVPFSGFEIKDDTDDGFYRFSGYASTFHNEDSYGDIIAPGAFTKTIKEKFSRGKIKVLWQHYEPFGMPEEMYEDSNGLYVTAKISKALSFAADYIQLMKDGVVDSMSIGFTIPKGKSEWMDEDGTERPKRIIRECNLFEFSAVTFPANELAAIESVKSHAELAAVLKSDEGKRLIEFAKSFDGADPRRVNAALASIEEIKALAFGDVKPSDDTPPPADEQPIEVADEDPEAFAKALQSLNASWKEENDLARAIAGFNGGNE